MIQRMLFTTAVAAVAVLGIGANAFAVIISDDFDTGALGDLTGTTNGQVVYVANGGMPPGTLTRVADGSAQSAPNVAELNDQAGAGSPTVLFRVDPSLGIDMSAAGASALIEFDFKSSRNGTLPVSLSFRAMWSCDANYACEDVIGNQHSSGLGDNGSWFLDNGGVGNAGAALPNYAANNWYHVNLSVTRPLGSAGGMDYTLELIDIDGGNVSLGTLSRPNANQAGRDWLTAVRFSDSSNAGEITLIDNFSISSPPIPEPSSIALLGLASMLLTGVRRRKA